MALVIRVGCFYSGGYTETGGMDQFLRNLRPDIEWVRCFPAHDKPAPKLGRPLREPVKKDGGVTGKHLVDRMLDRLGKHHQGEELDLVLLIDDVDCRLKDTSGAFAKQLAGLESQVREAVGKPHLRFLALLASPEIEAWLLADWERGFGKHYEELASKLRLHLQRREALGPAPWTNIEEYGGGYVASRGCCERKLSTDLQRALEELAMNAGGEVDQDTYTYSKKSDGPLMLQRIRPEKVAEICKRYFRPAYQELLSLQAAPPPSPPQAPVKTSARGAERPAGRASRRR